MSECANVPMIVVLTEALYGIAASHLQAFSLQAPRNDTTAWDLGVIVLDSLLWEA